MQETRAEQKSTTGIFDPVLKGQSYRVRDSKYGYDVSKIGVFQMTPIWGTKVFAEWTHGTGTLPDYRGYLETGDSGNLRVGLEVPLLKDSWTDKKRTQIRVSDLEVRSAEQSNASLTREVIRTAKYKYLEWLRSALTLKIYERQLSLALEREKIIDQRVLKGDSPRIELVDNSRAIAQRRAKVAESNGDILTQAQSLSLYFRNDDGSPRILGVEDAPNWEPAPEQLTQALEKYADDDSQLNSFPELLQLETQLQQNSEKIRLASNQALPSLVFELSSEQLVLNNATSEVWAGIRFEMPLLLTTARFERRALFQKELQIQQKRRLFRDKLSQEYRQALAARKAAYEVALNAHEEKQLSRNVESAERLKFDRGDSTIFLVNLREVSTADAELREIKAHVDFWKAQAELEALVQDPTS